MIGSSLPAGSVRSESSTIVVASAYPRAGGVVAATVGLEVDFEIPYTWSGSRPARSAIAALIGPSTIRLASRFARGVTSSSPVGLTAATCELGVSTSTRVVAVPTTYFLLFGGNEDRL